MRSAAWWRSSRVGRDSSAAMPSRIALLASSRERPLTVRSVPSLGGPPELLERLDAERLEEDPDRLRTRRRGSRSSSTRLGGTSRAQPLVEGQSAGRGKLGDLVADRLPDARDARRLPAR